MANYGRAFKDRAIERLLSSPGEIITALSRQLGVPAKTLERWRADALIDRGLFKAQEGDFPGSIADLSAVVEAPHAPSLLVTRALVNRGAVKIRADDADGAIQDFGAAIERRRAPVFELAPAHFNRGLARKLYRDDSEGAVRDFTAVIELPGVPNDLRAASLLNRAMIRERSGAVHEATADLKTMFAVPNLAHDLAMSAEAFCRRAMHGLQHA